MASYIKCECCLATYAAQLQHRCPEAAVWRLVTRAKKAEAELVALRLELTKVQYLLAKARPFIARAKLGVKHHEQDNIDAAELLPDIVAVVGEYGHMEKPQANADESDEEG